MLSKQDYDQIAAKGISRDIIDYQLEKFQSGFSFSNISKTATIAEGLLRVNDKERALYVELYDNKGDELEVTRFVPASGAATRMFKSLFSMLEKLVNIPAENQLSVLETDKEVKLFFKNLKRYPFYNDMGLEGNESYSQIIDKLLNDKGLSYGILAKGLLKFHQYDGNSRTAFEEHLREAAGYCASGDSIRMHFTISPEHKESFTSLQAEIVRDLEHEYSLKFHITYSFQKEETDTVAVDNDNQPFRNPEGRLVFRPGGHGALLENLNEISGDIVFISNIDNVAPDRFKDIRIENKKFLGGVLLKARDEVYSYLKVLKSQTLPDEKFFSDLINWMEGEMYISVPEEIMNSDKAAKREWAMAQLDRPIRVCGMVKNEGEPGGGPFFVKDANGNISLQVVELSQVDIENPDQKMILESSSHFNPVDLVCSIKNQEGEKYNLMEYRDPETGFISLKSMLGKDLKAQELPGLWNGSMAHWTTIFVEVPGITFTPVKTVFDLLRSEHLVK